MRGIDQVRIAGLLRMAQPSVSIRLKKIRGKIKYYLDLPLITDADMPPVGMQSDTEYAVLADLKETGSLAWTAIRLGKECRHVRQMVVGMTGWLWLSDGMIDFLSYILENEPGNLHAGRRVYRDVATRVIA